MTLPYEDLLVEPEMNEWAPLMLQHFRDAAVVPEWGAKRRAARRRLVESAETWVLRLQQIASRAGLPAVSHSVLTGAPDNQPIVMTGHQPVIFHSGLAFKYQTTEDFAARQSAICVGVVIDADEGDCGEIAVPHRTSVSSDLPVELPHLRRVSETVAQPSGLYLSARLRPAEEIRDVALQSRNCLIELGLAQAGELAQHRLQQYAQLADAGATALEASLLVRWQWGIGSRMLELPLSAICCFPETLSEFAAILTRGDEFCQTYNQALDRFREEFGIDNAANPFPNLETEQGSFELPFWLVDHVMGTRQLVRGQMGAGQLHLLVADREPMGLPLPVTRESLEDLLLQNVQLIPRGALITAILRVLYCDLFVHGTGGGKYDRLTSRLIQDWWQTGAAPFTVASASRYLFAEARRTLQDLEQLSKSLRDLQFNPQRHLGSGVFPEPLESQLRGLIETKRRAVEEMKQAHAENQSARETGRAIQQLTNQIRDAVSAEFQGRLASLRLLSAEERAAIESRTYAWLFFEMPR